MDYYKVRFNNEGVNSEALIALLGEYGFDMFEELSDGVDAYIPAEGTTEAEVNGLIADLPPELSGFSRTIELIPERNWNEEWEKSFDPVRIAGKVTIRAPFHPAPSADDIDLIIEPKMSFGTGHHPTTSLMVQAMLSMDFSGLSVLDMGCGSGVLAILALKRGAASVLAVDIDAWAVENTRENCERNNATGIDVIKGNASVLAGKQFDVVLANINRNILLNDMAAYSGCVGPGGSLLISGFLSEDREVLLKAAGQFGFNEKSSFMEKNWMMIHLKKEL